MNRTGVTSAGLAELLGRMPALASLGSWDDFSCFWSRGLELGHFTELRLGNTDLQLSALPHLSRLARLDIKMTNCSAQLHTLGCLRCVIRSSFYIR